MAATPAAAAAITSVWSETPSRPPLCFADATCGQARDAAGGTVAPGAIDVIGRLARCTALTVLNVVAAAAIALCVAGCGSSGGGSSTPPPPAGTIKLTSPALRADGRIPASFTCDGFGTQLPLRWSGVPRSARELALVMEDPDAPGGPYIHWVAYGIGPTARSVPASAREGRNSAGKTGWTPPCPPAAGKPHRYVFTLLALRRPSGLAAGASAAQVVGAARGRTLASGDLVARYGGR